MFCTKCGSRIDDDSLICPVCGTEQIQREEEPDGGLTVVYASQGQAGGGTGGTAEGAAGISGGQNAAEEIPAAGNAAASGTEMTARSAGGRRYYIPLLVIFGIAAAVLIIMSIATINSDEYGELKSQYIEYSANERETQQLADSYGGRGILGEGYETISDTWEELVEMTEDQMWNIRIRAIIFGAAGAACAVCFFCILGVTLHRRKAERLLQ